GVTLGGVSTAPSTCTSPVFLERRPVGLHGFGEVFRSDASGEQFLQARAELVVHGVRGPVEVRGLTVVGQEPARGDQVVVEQRIKGGDVVDAGERHPLLVGQRMGVVGTVQLAEESHGSGEDLGLAANVPAHGRSTGGDELPVFAGQLGEADVAAAWGDLLRQPVAPDVVGGAAVAEAQCGVVHGHAVVAGGDVALVHPVDQGGC